MASSTKKRQQPVYVTIIGIAIIVILAIAILSVVILSVSFKDENSAPSIFGYSLYIMDGNQMEPEIPKGSAIFAKTGPITSGNSVGVAALCKVDGGKNTTVMRIVNTEVDSNGLLTYWVRFDTQPENTAQIISASSVIGQAKFYSKGLGKFITFAVSPIGIFCLIIVPCVMFAVYQVLLIILKKNTAVSGEKKSFFLPEDVEIDEDAREEYKDTDADSFAPVSNGDLYQKPTARERKAQQEREMAQLARGFGTQVMSTHEIHRTPAEKKADTLDDVLFAAKKSTKPSPIPSKPQMSATEKYGLDKDDEELSFVRRAATLVSDTKYDDEKKAATPVKVKVKPKPVAVKPKVTEKSIEIEKITAVTETTPAPTVLEEYSDDIRASFEAAKAAREAKLSEERAEAQKNIQSAVSEVKAEAEVEIAKAITPEIEQKPAEPEIKIPAKSSNQKLEELMALLNMQNDKNKQ